MELESGSLFLGGNHEDTVLRVAAVARPVGAYVLIRCLVLEVVELLPVQGDVGERAHTVELFDYPDDFLGYLAREACERGDNPVVLRLGFQFAEITAEVRVVGISLEHNFHAVQFVLQGHRSPDDVILGMKARH